MNIETKRTLVKWALIAVLILVYLTATGLHYVLVE